MNAIPIPEHWTADEALEVVEFLEQIVGAIWNHHGWMMREALRLQYEPAEPPLEIDATESDDIIPF